MSAPSSRAKLRRPWATRRPPRSRLSSTSRTRHSKPSTPLPDDRATRERRRRDASRLLPHTLLQRLFIEGARWIRKGFARFYEFSPVHLNLSWVTDQLAVGGAYKS